MLADFWRHVDAGADWLCERFGRAALAFIAAAVLAALLVGSGR